MGPFFASRDTSAVDGPFITHANDDICELTMKILRSSGKAQLRSVDKEDEPPLRKLEFGMYGETVVSPGPEPPLPHMITRADNWFIPYRYDSSIVNEDLFRGGTARPALKAQFGEGADGADRFFRLVFGYCAGNPKWQSSNENRVLRGALQDVVMPHALRVFGAEHSPEAYAASYVYSMYCNVLLPGHIINMHLDVPEYHGLDRSKTPTWLLLPVVAHCSGLFDEHRVRNVTCVFYPKTSNGGALAAYPAVNRPGAPGHLGPPTVIPCEKGTVVCIDTDSHNHHSEQALPIGWKGMRSGALTLTDEGKPHPCPQLPSKASMSARPYDAALDGARVVQPSEDFDASGGGGSNDAWVWEVRDDETGRVVMSYPERDLRFSISCKVHVFPTRGEADAYHGVEGCTERGLDGAAEPLDAHRVLQDLVADLKRRGRVADDRAWNAIPLVELAPVLVDEYVTPTNPTPEEVETLWSDFYNGQSPPGTLSPLSPTTPGAANRATEA